MEDDQQSKNCTADNLPLCNFYASMMIVEFFLALPLNLSQQGERRSTEGGTCKAMLFMLFLNRGASIAFLTVISVDRYFNVVHPWKKNFAKTFKKSPHISVIIWLLLLPLTIPTMLKTSECCNSYGRKNDTLVEDVTDTLREVVFFTQILIPFFVLVYCTVHIVNRLKKKTVGKKTKLRRAVFLVTSVVLVFSFYFLPCTIARMVLLIVRVENLPRAEYIVVQSHGFILHGLSSGPNRVLLAALSSKASLYLTTYCPCLKLGESTNSVGNNSNPKCSNNNTSSNTEFDHCNEGNQMIYKVFSSVMIVEFTLALPLNLSVLYIFLFKFKFWKTNSIFLFNIVVADLLLVICLPAKAYHFQHGLSQSENNLVCKAVLFMLILYRGASIAFLTVLSIDRYFNVVHPWKKNFVKTFKKSPHISVIIWLLLLPLTIPTMLKTSECCNSYGRKNDTLVEDVTDTLREVVFFTQILIPFFVLVYCTVHIVNRLKKKTVGKKTKLRRAVFLVTSVVLVFSVCFLPSTIARIVLLIVRIKDLHNAETIAVQIYDSLMVLSHIDCLLDPLVYCFCCSGFRDVYMSNFCPFLLSNRRSNSSTVTDEQKVTSPPLRDKL
ncbi:unnamed protein product [Coregonus sp. 'balchen']|nr:unnamed protein product [Coregonus sp. 'balchen']